MPYLYNLDQDTQMQGQLPLPLPAKDVRIGRSDSETPQDLEVNGLGIALDHAIISPGDGATGRVLATLPGAVCYVNGKKTSEGATPVALCHGDRIVLGSCTMVFLYIDPASLLDLSLIDELCSYWDALEEIFAGPKDQWRANSVSGGASPTLGRKDSSDVMDDFDRMVAPAQTLEVHDFQLALTRVQRDVLQANAIGRQIGLAFEAHLGVGPLPVGMDALLAPKSEVLGMIPPAPMAFRVLATFEHLNDANANRALSTLSMGSMASFDATPFASRVVLMDCPCDEFAEISTNMITAYGDVAGVARGLLQASAGAASPTSPSGGLMKKATSFYGHVFRGLDVDGSGTISYAELKEGMKNMEIDITEAEMSAHFAASGSEELDEESIKQLLSRHLKLKLGAILESVYDPDAFALFLRDDLELTAQQCGHSGGARAAGRLAMSLAGGGCAAPTGRAAEAKAVLLEEAVLAASREVERLSARRQSVAARRAALESGAPPGLTPATAQATMAQAMAPATAQATAPGAPTAPGGGSDDGGASPPMMAAVSMEPVNHGGDTLHEGWMRRKASTMPYNWTKLWFVLKTNSLMMYDRPNGNLKEFLDLNAGIVISPDGVANRFAITASVRKEITVEAPSGAELEAWLGKLKAEGGRQIRRRSAADAAEGLN